MTELEQPLNPVAEATATPAPVPPRGRKKIVALLVSVLVTFGTIVAAVGGLADSDWMEKCGPCIKSVALGMSVENVTTGGSYSIRNASLYA